MTSLQLSENGQTIVIKTPIALIVNDTDFMLEAAMKGLGIDKIIGLAAREAIENGRLISILEPCSQQYSGLYLYFAKNNQKPLRVRELIDFLIEKARTHRCRAISDASKN